LRGHDEGVLCVNVMNSNCVISGGIDKTIRVWDLKSPKYKCKKFLGHTGWIKTLCYDQNRIISGSGDSTIKIWDLKNDKCVRTLRGHRAGISFVSCDPRSIVSSSVDKTIKWWDKTTGKCVSTLIGHESYVKCHQFLEYALARFVNERN
jgi:F-box/WD-40 domain protein MET30